MKKRRSNRRSWGAVLKRLATRRQREYDNWKALEDSTPQESIGWCRNPTRTKEQSADYCHRRQVSNRRTTHCVGAQTSRNTEQITVGKNRIDEAKRGRPKKQQQANRKVLDMSDRRHTRSHSNDSTSGRERSRSSSRREGMRPARRNQSSQEISNVTDTRIASDNNLFNYCNGEIKIGWKRNLLSSNNNLGTAVSEKQYTELKEESDNAKHNRRSKQSARLRLYKSRQRSASSSRRGSRNRQRSKSSDSICNRRRRSDEKEPAMRAPKKNDKDDNAAGSIEESTFMWRREPTRKAPNRTVSNTDRVNKEALGEFAKRLEHQRKC